MPVYKTDKKEDIEPIRKALKDHYVDLLDHLRTKYTSEWNQVNKELDEDIAKNIERFKAAGYPATVRTAVEIVLMDPEIRPNLRDYAKMVLEPPTRSKTKKPTA